MLLYAMWSFICLSTMAAFFPSHHLMLSIQLHSAGACLRPTMPGYVVDVMLLSTHLPHPSLFVFYATVDRAPEDLADPAYPRLSATLSG